ncbi:MAG: PASTA domain-containing protein [Clostridia bacterium]|nr:PASTA domain-containing protein [Clostridia bacterium]
MKKVNKILKKRNKKHANSQNIDLFIKSIFLKRSIFLLVMLLLVLVALVVRLGYIQFVQGNKLSTEAYKQQTKSLVISPKRGIIYDANGKILARSTAVSTISVNPNKIFYSNDTVVSNELLAKKFSELFDLNYDDVFKDLTSKSSVVTVAKKVSLDKSDELKKWLLENDITSGINIDEDTKRSYPYSTLASHLIGFCGSDNQGLEGLESEWDSTLSGTSGRIVTTTDVKHNIISDENEQYVPAENGSDIYLTIDVNVQSTVEKYLKQAVEENKADSGICIIMNPTNGDILSMANYPTFDLNTPFTPNTKDLKKKWNKLSADDQAKEIYAMWRNPAVSNGYEPGSTFKIVTSAIALEENLVGTDSTTFTCNRKIRVGENEISCWAKAAHGTLTLRKALEKSCNPSFVQIGLKIGTNRFYKYLDSFGLRGNTGARVAGEASGYFHDKSKCTSINLATMSFGQRFTITPLQLITTVSSIVNDGKLMQPRIVYKTVNSDTKVTTNLEPIEIRQVISEETSAKVRSMLESVVTDGTGSYASITGYTIGGKSGTSEPPRGKESEGYVASFISVAPIDTPQAICLVILKHPRGHSHQGGTVAAPITSQIMSEVLPYLGISSSASSKNKKDLISLTDVTGKKYSEAVKILKKNGFTVVNQAKTDNYIVSSQYPKAGISLEENSIICLYDENTNTKTVETPNLKGLSLYEVKTKLHELNLNIEIDGSGKAISQDISPGTKVEEGTIISVSFRSSGGGQ